MALDFCHGHGSPYSWRVWLALEHEMEGYLGDEGINPITAELFFKGEAAPDSDKVAQGRKRVGEELEYFSKELRGKFLAGDAPSAADLVLYPYLGYCARISFRKRYKKHFFVDCSGYCERHSNSKRCLVPLPRLLRGLPWISVFSVTMP